MVEDDHVEVPAVQPAVRRVQYNRLVEDDHVEIPVVQPAVRRVQYDHLRDLVLVTIQPERAKYS